MRLDNKIQIGQGSLSGLHQLGPVRTITTLDQSLRLSKTLKSGYSQIVDAIFGFSFYPEGGIRAPFGKLIDDLSESDVQILSVDVPSGWNVDSGPVFEKSK